VGERCSENWVYRERYDDDDEDDGIGTDILATKSLGPR